MRKSEAAVAVADLDAKVQDAVDDAIDVFTNKYASTETNNSMADSLAALNKTITEYVVISSLNSAMKKRHDQLKRMIDLQLVECGLKNEVPNGLQEELYQDNIFKFSKKRAVSSVNVAVKDFQLELQKLGVDQSLINKALENAGKERNGSVYYIVDLIE